MSQLLTINLSKGPGASWGFRLQGGKDFAQPLCIQKVNVGSVAEAAGLAAGDAIVSIGRTDGLALRHKEAQDAIVRAGNSFQMVVQRGAMTWRPQVTALAQPKHTPSGPVATQTSLAAPGKQPTKSSPRLNHIGSSHNNSPKPFPGPATWATSPIQSPPSYPNTPLPTPTNAYNNNNNNYSSMKLLDFDDSSPFGSTRARSLSRTAFSNCDLPSYSTETMSESRSLSHSLSKTSLRGCAGSPEPDYGHTAPSSRPYSAFSRRITNESLNETMDRTQGELKSSSSYYAKNVNNNTTTKRSGSSSNLSSKFANFSSEDLHHACVPTDGNCLDYRGPSPPLPPPPPMKSHPESRFRSPERSTSPTFYAVNPSSSQTSVTRTNGARGNRSPSPYYNSNYSRTPRSISPSCSIPSLPSTSSAPGCGGSNSSLPSPTVKSQVLDPVSDLELKNSLKIPGADISLDKENARNFLRKELERERGKDLTALYTTSGGAKKFSTTANNREYIEELKETWSNGNGRETFKTRKFSQDSSTYGANKFGSSNINNNSNSSLINASIKSHFTNKSSDNLCSDANLTNNTSRVPPYTNTSIVSTVGSVSDNIKRFNSGRRHSSFAAPQLAKSQRKARTVDGNGNSSYQRTTSTPTRDAIDKYNSRCRTLPRSSADDSYYTRSSLQRTPFTGSCSNLISNSTLLNSSLSDSRSDEQSGTNCNVPWKNHFSKLRRKSEGTAALRSRLETVRGGPEEDSDVDQQQRAPKGFNAVPAGFGEVNGQPIVNPQYNSPINIYNEDSIAEALSAQSEVLGKGCLGVNFMKNDRHGADRESDVLRMVQEMDKAPKTPPVASGTSSVYCAPLTPSEMIGTPEVPIQGASFRILERYLCGEDDKGSNLPSARGSQSGAYQMLPGENICAECARLIVGVFVRIKDKNLHADCFKCNTCGSSLKNVGYYNINDKMYCDVHAKQAAKINPPGPNLVPITVKPGAAPPAGAVPASAVRAPAHLAAAPPALATPRPPGGLRILPAPNFGGPATPYKPAPSFAPAPAPIPFQPVASGGSSANPAAFGAPSGGIDIRSHIPKKGPVASPVQAPVAPKPAPVVAPAPVFAPAPIFAPAPKPAPAPAPVPAPMFGGGGMPKPIPPPGMGGLAKPPGVGGPPTKGIPGERTAPKRGRGVMTAPAHASRIPICANCQRQIRGPFVTALGKNWCPDHFHCATESCRKPLIDVGFVEEQASLYCEDCYEKYLAPTCGKCDKRIKGDCLNAVGKQFHPECFACAYCGKVFGSGAFYLEDGLPYCETDWNDLFTTKCVGCGFPIEAGDRWVEALNNNYHSQCFKCSKCHKNLEGQSFFAKGGKPFCKSHAQRGF